jgi:hypothetical protein
MENNKKISFALKDTVLGEQISPSNITMPMLSDFAEQVTAFLKGSKKVDLKEVKTSIKEGSFAITVENNVGMLDEAFKDYQSALKTKSLDIIDPVRAKIIKKWQDLAKLNKDRSYELSIDDSKISNSIFVISSDSEFITSKSIWVDTERYIYGRVYDLGGKSKPNVHLELSNGSTVTVGTSTKLLTGDRENRLYKDQLVRVRAKQNLVTKEFKDESLLSFENYDPHYDEEEFMNIVKQARVAWKSVKNASKWVEEMRGNNV